MKTDYFKDLRHTAGRYDFMLAFTAILALFTALNVYDYGKSFILELLVLVMLLALLVVRMTTCYRCELLFPKQSLVYWWLAFIGWCVLSLVWSAIKGITFLMILTMFTAPLSLLLGFWSGDRQWQWFMRLLQGLALLVCGMTAYQAYVLHIERPAGFLLNWNTNSAFLGTILLPNCAVYLRQVASKEPAFGLGVFLFVNAFAMSLGQGRASLLVMALGLMVLFWTYRGQAKAGRRIAGLLLWIAGGYLLADLSHGGLLIQRMKSALLVMSPQSSAGIESLGSGREYLWAAGWQMFLERPWLGWGLGLYRWLYPQYRSALHVEDGNFAHNDYLQFLLELGPLGLLLCLGCVFALLLHSCRLFRATSLLEQRITDLGLSLACAAMLFHAVVDFHLYQTCMLILLGAYSGRLCRQWVKLEKSGAIAWRPRQHLTATGYFSVLGGMSLLVLVACFNIGMAFLTAGTYQNSDNVTAVFAKLDRADHFIPWVEHFRSIKGQVILNLLKNQPGKGNEEDRRIMIAYGLQQLDQAIELNPLSAPLHIFKAELLTILPERQTEAEHHIRLALQIDPYQLAARLYLVKQLEQRGDAQQASQLLAEGLNKAYLIDRVPVVIDYWQTIEKMLGDSWTWQSQRQAVRQQIQMLVDLRPLPAGKRLHLTLPDIGWKPDM